jgi:hypothetical protein
MQSKRSLYLPKQTKWNFRFQSCMCFSKNNLKCRRFVIFSWPFCKSWHNHKHAPYVLNLKLWNGYENYYTTNLSCNFILVPNYNCDSSPPQGGQHDLVVLIKNPIFVPSYNHPCITWKFWPNIWDKFLKYNVDNTWKLWEELRSAVLQKGMEISCLI